MRKSVLDRVISERLTSPGGGARRRPHRRQAARRAHRRGAGLPGWRQVFQVALRRHRPGPGLHGRRSRRAAARGHARDALSRRHHADGDRAALHAGRLHPPLGTEPRGERHQHRPGGIPGRGETHGGEPQGLLRRPCQGIRGARAGARGVRRAFAGCACREDAARSRGREEVLRVEQVALRVARGTAREPHPAHGQGGGERGRAQGRRDEGGRTRGRAEEEARELRRTGEEGVAGSGFRRAGWRPRILPARGDGEALRGRGLRREEGRDLGTRPVGLRLPHDPRHRHQAGEGQDASPRLRRKSRRNSRRATPRAASPMRPRASPTWSTSSRRA